MIFTEEREITRKIMGNIVKIFPTVAEASRRGLEGGLAEMHEASRREPNANFGQGRARCSDLFKYVRYFKLE